MSVSLLTRSHGSPPPPQRRTSHCARSAALAAASRLSSSPSPASAASSTASLASITRISSDASVMVPVAEARRTLIKHQWVVLLRLVGSVHILLHTALVVLALLVGHRPTETWGSLR